MDDRIALRILEELTKVREIIERAPEMEQVLINLTKDRVDRWSAAQKGNASEGKEQEITPLKIPKTAPVSKRSEASIVTKGATPKESSTPDGKGILPSIVEGSLKTKTDPPQEQDQPESINWIDIAESYVDKIDENDEQGFKQIQAWGESIGFPVSDPSVPWCGVFVGGILLEAGIDNIKSARARDYAKQGNECEPRRGAIWVANSHVAFIDKVHDDGAIDIIGGNQSNKVCIQSARYYGEPIAIRWPI